MRSVDAMTPRPGNYFQSADEANEWLEFDEVGIELDIFADRYPDTYAEWQRWKAAETA